jgi:hypothetical protein
MSLPLGRRQAGGQGDKRKKAREKGFAEGAQAMER